MEKGTKRSKERKTDDRDREREREKERERERMYEKDVRKNERTGQMHYGEEEP